MYVEAMIIVPLNVLTIIFMRNKPKFPPRYIYIDRYINNNNSISSSIEKTSFIQSLRELINPSYAYLLVSFSLVLGVFNGLATLVEPLIQPFGYGSDDSSVIGGLLIGLGVLGSIIFGVVIEKTLAYKKVIVCLTLMGVLMMLSMGVCFYYEMSLTLVGVAMGALGFVLVPVMPLSFELACEISFPVGEALAAGMLVTGGQLVGIILISTFTYFPIETKREAYILISTTTALLVFALLSLLPLK
jgi:hypothetical protein